MSSVTERWWEYIRREGDEVGYKDFDLGELSQADLDELIGQGLDDDRLDDLVQHMGRAFKPEMTRRSTFASELFPMSPYACLSLIEDFHTYADRVRTIEAAMRAEDIGRHHRAAPALISPLWIWMAGYHFLCGREFLITMGRLRRDEKIDEIRTVVDFWRRLSLSHRGDGTLDNKDAGYSNRYLPDDVVTRLVAAAQPLDDGSRKALRRLNATISGYAFLYFTDSRVGVYDSGPYPQPAGRRTIVRDYLSLGPSSFAYPWATQVDPPFPSCSLVLTYDPSYFSSLEINDWGTTFSEPEQFMNAVTAAAVVAHTDRGDRVVPAEEWADVTTAFSKTHMRLYQEFADMDREGRIFSATTMYCWGLRPFADFAGVTDKIEWEVSPATRALYPDPLDDDDYATGVFGGAVVANDMKGSFSPLR